MGNNAPSAGDKWLCLRKHIQFVEWEVKASSREWNKAHFLHRGEYKKRWVRRCSDRMTFYLGEPCVSTKRNRVTVHGHRIASPELWWHDSQCPFQVRKSKGGNTFGSVYPFRRRPRRPPHSRIVGRNDVRRFSECLDALSKVTQVGSEHFSSTLFIRSMKGIRGVCLWVRNSASLTCQECFEHLRSHGNLHTMSCAFLVDGFSFFRTLLEVAVVSTLTR